jgi:hypothetical protein
MVRLLVFFAFTLWTVGFAHAGPSDLNRAKRSLVQIKKAERGLSLSMKKLTAAERSKLKRSTRGLDSDGDGIADVLEPYLGASRCDADSDDDGIDDDDDLDEDGEDNDSDGTSDGAEAEIKGRIEAFNDPVVTIGSATGQITSATRFYRGLSSKSDLVLGTCVEARGRRDSGAFIIEEIKRERSHDCGDGFNE